MNIYHKMSAQDKFHSFPSNLRFYFKERYEKYKGSYRHFQWSEHQRYNCFYSNKPPSVLLYEFLRDRRIPLFTRYYRQFSRAGLFVRNIPYFIRKVASHYYALASIELSFNHTPQNSKKPGQTKMFQEQTGLKCPFLCMTLCSADFANQVQHFTYFFSYSSGSFSIPMKLPPALHELIISNCGRLLALTPAVPRLCILDAAAKQANREVNTTIMAEILS